jgi:hypothetical protein
MKWKSTSLEATEFIRRFLMHVVPSGFMRIRYYGFLANRFRQEKLAHCRELLGVIASSEKTDVSESEINDHEDHKQEAVSENQHRSCPECGEGTLVNVETLQPTSGIVPTCSRAPPVLRTT